MRGLAFVCAATAATGCVASRGAAQTTHVVGPGGYTQIDHALAAAQPGDVIVVHPGSWAAFHATIGVTIRALAPNTATLGPFSSAVVPASQRLHLVNLGAFNITITGAGITTIDTCRILGFGLGGTVPALHVVGSEVHLQSCDVRASGGFGAYAPALLAQSSVVTAVDCKFDGADGVPQTLAPAGEGVSLQGSLLHGCHLTLLGGDGIWSGTQADPQPALRAVQSTVWLADSVLTGGADGGGSAPACAIDAAAGRLVRCTTTTPVCGGIPLGGRLLAVQRPTSLARASTFSLDFRGEPGDAIAVFVDGELGGPPLPELEQPMALAPTALPLALLTADATGAATATWTVPPAVADRTWWLQAVAGTQFPLQLSPVVGGVAR